MGFNWLRTMISKLQPIEYHPKFELLRGIAAIIVLIVHAIQLYWFRLIGSSNEIALISGLFGRHAVLLFFLLSGYLITLSILTNIIRNQRFDWTEYAAARIARIYPPLIGAIILVVIAWFVIRVFHLPGYTHYGIATDKYIARERFDISWRDVKRTLLMANGFLQANGPLWSLYIEWHLYVIAMFFTITITVKSNLYRILSGLAIGFFFI